MPVSLLAIDETTLLDLVQKGGVVGILLVLVYLLGRMHLKSIAEKDAQIARAMEREGKAQAREVEYVEQRRSWTATIETMARNNLEQTAATKDLATHFAAFRTRFDEHEDRCNKRRGDGD